MSIDPVRLSEWLRRAVLNPKLPRIRQIEICQAFPGGERRTVSVLDWDEKEPIPKIEEILMDLTDRSTSYAEGKAEGTIRFEFQAYHGSVSTPWGTIFPCFVVARSPEAESASFGQSEPATGQGLLSQLMRHIEKREETSVKAMDVVHRMYSKTIGDLQTKVDLFESRHFDTIKLYEDLLDRKHDRELTALFRGREDERKAKIWDLVMSLGPMIASKFLDPRLVAAMPSQITNGGPAMAMVRQLVKTIRPEQLPQLMQTLSTEQSMILMELHGLIEQEVVAEQQKEDEMRNVVPPSADAIRREREGRSAAPSTEEELQGENEVVVEAEPDFPHVPPPEEDLPVTAPETPKPKKSKPAPKTSSKKASSKKVSSKKASTKSSKKRAA